MASLHQGIDLSRFKKIASDGKTSTLRHAKGHEVKIAHKGLSPKMQEHLSGMPLHLAETGDVQGIAEEDKTPVLAEDATEPMPQQSGAAPVPMAPEQADAKETSSPLVIDNITPGAYTPSPAPQPKSGISPEDKMTEHMNYAADMAAGHIQPKTYSDLFADKGTLGKVGTLFGLMLSGAGSGLTHQPNMVMEMMNKVIDRDFEKQKLDKENARNFLSLQYQHNLQQAQIAEHQQHVLGSQVEMAPKAAAAEQYLKSMGVPGTNNYFNDNILKAQQIWTPFETKAKMLETAVAHLDNITKNNPQANAVVQGMVKPASQQEVAKTLAQGAQAVKAHSQLAGGRPMPVDEDKLGQAIRMGQNTPAGLAYQPGAIAPHDIPAIQKEKADLIMNRNGALDWNDSFNNLAKKRFAGQAPGVSAAITGAGTLLGSLTGGWLGGGAGGALSHTAGQLTQGAFERERNIEKDALRKRLGGNSSDASSEALIDSLLPAWNDTPESMKEAHRKGVQHFQSLEATPTLDTYANQIQGLKSPFPNLSFGDKKQSHKKGK